MLHGLYSILIEYLREISFHLVSCLDTCLKKPAQWKQDTNKNGGAVRMDILSTEGVASRSRLWEVCSRVP